MLSLINRDHLSCIVIHLFAGSISAEHGVGQQKVSALVRSRSPAEVRMMHQLKNTLDPNGILNPGKMLALQE